MKSVIIALKAMKSQSEKLDIVLNYVLDQEQLGRHSQKCSLQYDWSVSYPLELKESTDEKCNKNKAKAPESDRDTLLGQDLGGVRGIDGDGRWN